MGKLQHNQSGFSAVEALLVLVILGLIGFTGWYVWHARQTISSDLDKAANTQQDPYANWKTYSNAQYNFSVKYPASWHATKVAAEGVAGILLPNAVAEFDISSKPYGNVDFQHGPGTFYHLIVTQNTTTEQLIQRVESNLATPDAAGKVTVYAHAKTEQTINGRTVTFLTSTATNNTLVQPRGVAMVEANGYTFLLGSNVTRGDVATLTNPIARHILTTLKIQ